MSAETEKIDAAATARIIQQVKNLDETIAIITNLHAMISQSQYLGSAAAYVSQGLRWLEEMKNDLTGKRDGFAALLPKPPATADPKTTEAKGGSTEPGTPPVVPGAPIPPAPATPPEAPKEPA